MYAGQHKDHNVYARALCVVASHRIASRRTFSQMWLRAERPLCRVYRVTAARGALSADQTNIRHETLVMRGGAVAGMRSARVALCVLCIHIIIP